MRETLRALIEWRRLVPVLLMGLALVAAQVHLSRSPESWLVAFAMAGATWAIAPFSWRALFADGRGGLGRIGLYALLAVAVVIGTGPGLSIALGVGASFLTIPSSLAVCVALFVVGGWGLGRDIELERRLTQEQAKVSELARAAERSQLLALKTHLDPHFLFNTLNAIAEWCRQDGEIAERAVLRLSAMLRDILQGVKAPSWPLARELELVHAVFELHQLRDPNLFTLEWKVEGAPELEVPPLLLVPLAENAVKHGPSAGHRGTITFTVIAEAGGARVTIENPGPFRGPRPGSDGLPTLERRLALAYGGAATLSIAGVESRTRVELRLPATHPSEEAA
jgi:two-component system sensor histidine kinase AlgZ